MIRAERPTAESLRRLPARELVRVFRGLPAPELAELDGEYAAELLDQGSWLGGALAGAAIHARGRWMCKAFQPLPGGGGHGYNSFRTRTGATLRTYRMRTHVGPSLVGGAGDSFHLDYAPFNRGPLATMRDELRQVAPGLYLGVGRVGWGTFQRRYLMPFLLVGPTGPFVPADEGTRRGGRS